MVKYKQYIKILIIVLSLSVVFIFRDSALHFNQKCNNLLYILSGQSEPDTNIVIIHIDRTDVENLGPWPLKRSYYALLLNHLTNLRVKTIGFEIFLSDRFSSQSIYNDLLNNEIKKSRNMIFSSMIEDSAGLNGTGRLLLPQPKHSIKELKTGHLNYIDNYGLFIPLKYHQDSAEEEAFSYIIAKENKFSYVPDSLIKVNLTSSWKKFKNFSLIEFFNLLEVQSSELKSLENKTILIGVSDPQIAHIVSSAFDSELPGIGLQAFALENLLHRKYIKTNYTFVLSILFILLLATAFIKISVKSLYKYVLLAAVFFLLSFIFFKLLYIQPDYSIFLVPFLILAAYELSWFAIEKKRELRGIGFEAEKLKASLEEKEHQLSMLQKELNLAGSNSPGPGLVEKVSSLKEEIERLKLAQSDSTVSEIEQENPELENFHGIIYKSREMSSIVSLINKVAPSDVTVLVLGESGTGKELAARAIHILNPKRSSNNFIAVNCAALSDTLLESELFGHVKGAFTNAISDKIGRFEAADKGTIFLDEIGETSENFQVKLLRILQTGEFEKVGSSRTIKTDVRVIAATNKNLEQLVSQKKFREDLYYRLNVIKVELPPLRERKEDVDVIAAHFLNSGEEKYTLSVAALEQLRKHEWKGNVRELESVIKRAVIFAKASNRKVIRLNDLPEEILSRDKSNLEVMIIESLRDKKFSHSSINETAKELGDLSRTIVSENFRGIIFRTYYNSGFNMEKTIGEISATDDSKVIEKVSSKIRTYLCNIEEDVSKLKPLKFEEVKLKLSSKYKNLPQKYHFYLDEIIKEILK